MYKEAKESRFYLCVLDEDIFYWSDEEKDGWLISTINFDYIDRVVSLLNARKYSKKINNLGRLTMSDILENIVDIALVQDTDCHIHFNGTIFNKD